MLGGDCHELPAIRVAAIYFVQTAWRIAGSADDRSTREDIMSQRSGLGAVEQAGARFNFQSKSHDPLSFIDAERDQTGKNSDYFGSGVREEENTRETKKVRCCEDEF